MSLRLKTIYTVCEDTYRHTLLLLL